MTLEEVTASCFNVGPTTPALLGSVTSHAVSRRLHTAMARFRFRHRSGFVMGEMALGQVLLFSLSIIVPPASQYTSAIQAWYNRATAVPNVPSGLSLILPHTQSTWMD